VPYQEWSRSRSTESQVFPECTVRRLSACTRVPRKEDNSLYLIQGAETDESVAKDKAFARTGNQAGDSWISKWTVPSAVTGSNVKQIFTELG